ncbi:MAG TPA: molybdenum cofactor guanylyltransferase [Bacillales bacterium]|nr:molybdenum cofactor guanylyltransferase [Bacillales bacterium]
MKISGIVLAGGESKRFGAPKAFAIHNEKYFYEHICEVLRPYVDNIIIVTRPELLRRFRNHRIIMDDSQFKGMGPLAGLYSGMRSLSSEWYCVLACDMPMMDQQSVRSLVKAASKANGYEAVVPNIDGRVQPLAAMYRENTVEILESLLVQGKRKVGDFLNEIQVYNLNEQVFGANSNSFINVNTREDFARLQEEEEL